MKHYLVNIRVVAEDRPSIKTHALVVAENDADAEELALLSCLSSGDLVYDDDLDSYWHDDYMMVVDDIHQLTEDQYKLFQHYGVS